MGGWQSHRHSAVLFHGSAYKEFEIVANDFLDSADTDMLVKFWQGVQNGVAPDWDGALATYEAVRVMHPDIDGSTVELGDLGMHLVNAASDFEAAKEKFTELKSRTLDALGSAKYGVVDGASRMCRKVHGRRVSNAWAIYLSVGFVS